MIVETLKVGDIKKAIKESVDKFEPKFGKDVQKDNKKNNDKTYEDTKKEIKTVEKFPGATDLKEVDRSDDKNLTTLDYNPGFEPDENYKKRIKAQAKGYVSVEDEKKGSKDKNALLDDNDRIYKSIKKNSEKKNKAREEIAHSGIVGQNMEKKERKTFFENKTPKTKRLIFKKTTFINEAQMLSLIPEEYKVDGQKIYMKDKKDNEYIVECNFSRVTNNVETNVLNFNNERILNEQLKRMNELFNYDGTKSNTSQLRGESDKYLKENFQIVRK